MGVRRNRLLRVLGIVLAAAALIGLARFAGGMNAVNAGIFLCPAVLSAVCFMVSRPQKRRGQREKEESR